MSEFSDNNQFEILKKNIQVLLKEYNLLKEKYKNLEAVHQQQSDKMLKLMDMLEQKNNVEPVKESSAAIEDIKSKLAEYIKEIDVCIALMATQE
ncbi:MAG: hypothetical protein U0V72_09785 [Cytophagales bacterium]